MFKAGEASGASGSFFFFSEDKKFIVKTMTVSEMKFFEETFGKAYFSHLSKNRNSMIARIYGIFKVKIRGIQEVNLMLMGHTLQIKSDEHLERIFDIKGSKVKREVHLSKQTKNTKTLKDVNFLTL